MGFAGIDTSSNLFKPGATKRQDVQSTVVFVVIALRIALEHFEFVVKSCQSPSWYGKSAYIDPSIPARSTHPIRV